MSKRKLLLADDSITIQKVVNLTFADEGIEVIAVGDGDAAMKKFVEDTPDLVMADVNMPGVDGYQICEMIKQDDETKQIPVILLVGSFEPFDEEEARRVGADDYLTKPFQSIRQLVNKVTDLLNSANGEQSANVEETAQSEPSAPIYTETSAAELGDAGMDDEMIQTNQIGSLPIDEPQKFESDSAEQSFENIPPPTLRSPYQTDFGSATQYQSGGDFAKTQPLTTQEFRDITAPVAEDETAPSAEKGYEITDEQEFEQAEIIDEREKAEPETADSQAAFEPVEIDEQQYFAPEPADETEQSTIEETEPAYPDESEFAPVTEISETSETSPMPEPASVLDLDEMNLLELPPREKRVFPDFQAPSVEPEESSFQTTPVEPEEFETATEEPETEIAETPPTEQSEVDKYFETITDATELISLSPESIEAIAEKVADLVIQKLAQASVDEN